MKIYVAGHSGVVGSSVRDVFRDNGYSNIITRSSSELDLRNQEDVVDFIRQERPDAIVLAAGRVEGPRPLTIGSLNTKMNSRKWLYNIKSHFNSLKKLN